MSPHRFLLPAAAAALLAFGACTGPAPPRSGTVPPDLLERAEDARGLAFAAPVTVKRISSREVRAVVAAEIDLTYEPAALQNMVFGAAALGLLESETDLREVLLRFSTDAVAGFYAPSQRMLYVVEDGSRALHSEVLDAILVHELTHALQDAHGVLLDVALGVPDQDDLAFALGAWLEGDALITEYRDAVLNDRVRPPTASQLARLITPETTAAEYSDTPRIVREPFALQYPLGYALAEALERVGGTAALDAAMADPPLSSEQFLHPEKYRDPSSRDLPSFLSLPTGLKAAQGPNAGEGGCVERQRTTFGELGVRIWLSEALRDANPGDPENLDETAAAAAAGWGGDRIAVLECGGGLAFAWMLRFDTHPDASEFTRVARGVVPGLRDRAGLIGSAGVVQRGVDVLVSAGIDAREEQRLFHETREVVYTELAAFLRDHPEVMERARRVREEGARRLSSRPR